jgi:hypothetical protein
VTRNDDEIARLEELLDEARPPRLPDRARFVDRVMQRVMLAGSAAPLVRVQPVAPMPWWVPAASDPAAVLACLLMALFLWKPNALVNLLLSLSDGWNAVLWPGIARAREAFALDRPTIALGLGIVALFLVGWVSLHLYRWTERVTRRAAGAWRA